MNWIKAALAIATITTLTPTEAAAFGGMPGPGTIGPTFDGRRITRLFVERNFANGAVISFGDCDDDLCDMRFTELNSAYSDNTTVTLKTTTWMLSEQPCVLGDGCLNGYQVAAHIYSEMILDGENRETRGTMEFDVGRKLLTMVGVRVSLQNAGKLVWAEDASKYEYATYRPDDRRLEDMMLIASTTTGWCGKFTHGMGDFAASNADGAAGAVSQATVAEIVGDSNWASGFATGFSTLRYVGFGGADLEDGLTEGAARAARGLLKTLDSGISDAETFCEDLIVLSEQVDFDRPELETGETRSLDEECPSSTTEQVCEDCTDKVSRYMKDGELIIEYYETCDYFSCCVP